VLLVVFSFGAPKGINATSAYSVNSPFLFASQSSPVQLGADNFPDNPVVETPPCNVQTDKYCIVDGNFIFESPVDPALTHPITNNYKYSMDDGGTREPHRGVDFSSNVGTPALAAADGEVVFAGMEKTKTHSPWVNYYGNFIVLRHANDLYTLYAHLSRIDVVVGQKVQVGETIGAVGQTGAAIGPHLHFEVRQGSNGEDFYSTQNPELWLALEKDQNGVQYGALSIIFDTGSVEKVERNLVVDYYIGESKVADRIIFSTTYPAGFENNAEDAVLSNLRPGRYRVVMSHRSGPIERWVMIEAGKLTQVYMTPK